MLVSSGINMIFLGIVRVQYNLSQSCVYPLVTFAQVFFSENYVKSYINHESCTNLVLSVAYNEKQIAPQSPMTAFGCIGLQRNSPIK